MARRVFLHVGVPKSGTTFLQTAMWNNRAALKAGGLLYPGSKRMDHYHASHDVRSGPAASTGAWDRLLDELARWQRDAIISHEFFSMATAEQARGAVRRLEPAEVHVVLTARDYVRQFPAVWQEALKMSGRLSLDEFMDQAAAGGLRGAWSWRSQDVPAILERWGASVPRDRVHIVTVPRSSAPRELLWERWRELLEIDDSGFDLERSFTNESLGAAQAALLLRVKPFLSGPLLRKPVQHRWVRQYFGHEVLGAQNGERFGLRPHHVEELRRRAIEAVELLGVAGYDVVGDLEELVPEDPPPRPHPDDVTEAEMLDVAGLAIDQMIRDVRRLTAERDRLRAASRSGKRAWFKWSVAEVANAVRKRVGA